MGVDIYCHCRCVDSIALALSQSDQRHLQLLLEHKDPFAAWEFASEATGRQICPHYGSKIAVFTPGTFKYVEFLSVIECCLNRDFQSATPVLAMLLADYRLRQNTILIEEEVRQLHGELNHSLELLTTCQVPVIDMLSPDVYDYEFLGPDLWFAAFAGENAEWSFCIHQNQIAICNERIRTAEQFAAVRKWSSHTFEWRDEIGGYLGADGEVCPCPDSLWHGTSGIVDVPAIRHFTQLRDVLTKLSDVCRISSFIEISL